MLTLIGVCCSCIALMAPFFKFNLTPTEWLPQAINNIAAMLRVLGLLVAPDNPPVGGCLPAIKRDVHTCMQEPNVALRLRICLCCL